MPYTTIDDPTIYFNTVLYTGNGGTGHAITGVGFQPDWVWLKCRSSAHDHFLFDAVNGVKRFLSTNDTGGLATADDTYLSVFGSDGFTLNNSDGMNESSQTFASWNWKANGSGSANTDGSISSTVSANNTSGFSIVKYTGTGSAGNVGHGLSTAPTFLINKALGTQDWFVGCSALGFTKFLKLNETNAESTNSGLWNDTAPTTDHFTINSANGNTNASGVDYITYCFAEKQGYSKFGSFAASNPCFVYTGFKPAFVMIKRHSATGNWHMLDNKRANSFNPQDPLYANATDTEQTGDDYDLVSNGFVVRNAAGGGGGDSGTAIFMAFAESPFVTSTGIPTTAR